MAVITKEEIRKLPIEERERIISKMNDEEINEFLRIKPLPKSIWKRPHETAAQTVRRIRTQLENGGMRW